MLSRASSGTMFTGAAAAGSPCRPQAAGRLLGAAPEVAPPTAATTGGSQASPTGSGSGVGASNDEVQDELRPCSHEVPTCVVASDTGRRSGVHEVLRPVGSGDESAPVPARTESSLNLHNVSCTKRQDCGRVLAVRAPRGSCTASPCRTTAPAICGKGGAAMAGAPPQPSLNARMLLLPAGA